jgi:lantibiotic modifying enzyme
MTVKSWEPLLQGKTVSRAWDVVLELSSVLAEEAAPLASASYSKGHSGIALFYSYLAAATAQDQAADLAAGFIDRALDACDSARHSELGLFGGISGVAWTYRHVNELMTGEVCAGLTEDVDLALLDAVQRSPWQWEYDLFYGLTGLGIYALDHADRTFSEKAVSAIVTRLEELAVPCNPGVTWVSHPKFMPLDYQETYPNGRYDFCMAHGVSGVIGFLAECCHRDFERSRAAQLLRGAVEWLLAHKRPEDEGSTFSAFLDTYSQSCRSAWCYGDPGVCAALLSAAQALEEPTWEQEALSIALKDCRRPPEDCRVFDAQVCHGAAGLGHLYNRLYHATGLEEFGHAARGWFERTLDMRVPGQGIAGYLSWWATSSEWTRDPGLLGGAAGIGLSLLGAISETEPRWDRPFLLANL